MIQKTTRENVEKQTVTAEGQQSALKNSQYVQQNMASDIILTDDQGERIAAMREYVFLNLTLGN